MNKKILAFITALILLVSSVHVLGFAADDASQGTFQFSELGSEYDLLKELGIISVSNGEALDAEVTRGEFAHLAVRSLNLKNTAGTNLNFTDVPKNHMYYNEIGALVNLGILKGTSNTTFSPKFRYRHGRMKSEEYQIAPEYHQ